MIKEYKGYKYIVYDNNNIYFNASLYMNSAYNNLERTIKNKITRLDNEHNEKNDYYTSKEYCNMLVENERSNYNVRYI